MFLAECSESCVSDKENKIYGDFTYSSDSVICKAAFHAGIISNNGGLFLIKVENG